MQITKTYLYNITVGGFYSFRVFLVVDAHKQRWFIGEPVARGGTKTADTIPELHDLLSAQVPLLNKYTERTR